MRKKIILVDLLNLASPQIAGVGVFTRNLFKYWLQNKRSYKIVCYAVHGIDVERIFGLNVSNQLIIKSIRAKHVIPRLLYQQIALPFQLRGCDVYYNPAVGLPFLARIIAPKAKLLVTIHDMTPFFHNKKYSLLRSILVKFLSKSAARTAHQIITVSENSKRDITAISKVPETKTEVIYNFIPPPYELDNDSDDHYFLCISTIEPGKNLENTMAGFSEFLKDANRKNYKFYWIGRIGWVVSKKDIDDLLIKHKLANSFFFLGYLDEETKASWIRNCTAIVYLSFYEGFGLPILEGMALNKPSVISDCSSLPEVAGDAGIRCDPRDPYSIADGLRQVLLSRSGLVQAIPEQLSKFKPEHQIETFTRIIENNLMQDSR